MQMKNLAVLVALPFALVACGGDSGSSSGVDASTPGASISSQFIDAPVKGLKVEKDSGDSETGANGIFNCQAGENIKFWLKEIGGKGILLGEANCGSKIFIEELGANAVKAGALIQSLSTGDHSSRTELDLSAFNSTDFDLNAAVPNLGALGENDAATIVASVTAANSTLVIAPVTLTAAQAHITANLPPLNDTALSAIANAEHTLTLKGNASNSADHCWPKIQVKVQVDEIPKTDSGKAYRFKVNEYLAWEGSETAPVPVIDLDNEINQCDGNEHSPEAGIWFQCIKSPVSKIMSGRSVSGTHYETHSYTIAKDAPAICRHSEGYEFWLSGGIVTCDEQDGETPLFAANELKLEFGLGWNFKIDVTDSSYTVNFTEQAIDIGATLNATDYVTAYTQQKFNCSYSATDSIDGESTPIK